MSTISLQQLRIASPCTASWDNMAGDDCSRFCGQCRLNVYNFAAMTQREVEQLILSKEGRICARLYQRRDGTVLVRDCPVGLAALRRRATWLISHVAAAVTLAAGGFAWAIDFANPYRERAALDDVPPLATLSGWLREPPSQSQWIMGDLAPIYPVPPMPTMAPAAGP